MKNNNNITMITFCCVLIMISLSSNISTEAARITAADANCDYQTQVSSCIPYMSGDQVSKPSKDCCKQIKKLLSPPANKLKPVCTCIKSIMEDNPKANTMVNECKAQSDIANKCPK
ncbi:hypothetical protein LINGRAHAP2_LOCUS26980 [Linum grandiflorum]